MFVAWEDGYAKEAIQKTTELRAQGKKVKIAFNSMSETLGRASHGKK